jgi:hypothetical protein
MDEISFLSFLFQFFRKRQACNATNSFPYIARLPSGAAPEEITPNRETIADVTLF